MMNADLWKAIDDLYEVFASYPLDPAMSYCSHCVSEYEQPVLPLLEAWSEVDSAAAASRLCDLVESCVHPPWLNSDFDPELDRWIASGIPTAILAKAAVADDSKIQGLLEVLRAYQEHQASRVAS